MIADTGQKKMVWIFMVDSRNSRDLRDLDHLDEILWGANPNARKGDIVLMYRTAPYSDFAYVFSATSDPRPTRPEDHADMDHVIELGNKVRLRRPVGLGEIRNDGELAGWSFARHQQGVMRRRKDIKEEGAWPALRVLLIARNPYLAGLLDRLEGLRRDPDGATNRTEQHLPRAEGRGPLQLRVFMSYASPDLRRVRSLYSRLSREPSLGLWFDKESLFPTDEWYDEIVRAISACDVAVVCLSSRSVGREGFAQVEIGWAVDLADEQPEGAVSILPVKLDRCEVPGRLARWQYAELFRKGGYERLVAGLRKRTAFLTKAGLR